MEACVYIRTLDIFFLVFSLFLSLRMGLYVSGIKICGGCSIDGEELHGVFIKRVLPGGQADTQGNGSFWAGNKW